MGAFDSLLAELKRDFAKGCPERFRQLMDLCSDVERGSDPLGALRELMRKFHSIAGVGATCGFARVTDLARRGEEETDSALRSGEVPTREQVAGWRDLISAMDTQVALNDPSRDVPVSEPVQGPKGPVVLIAFQGEPANSSLVKLLQERGFGVLSASTMEEAKRCVTARMPAAILAGASNPSASGYELVAWVRGLSCGETPLAYILCQSDKFLNKIGAVRCGADGFFVEPFDLEGIAGRLCDSLLHSSVVEPPRVLSVEDDPDFAKYITAVLESGGYLVKVCPEPGDMEAELSSFNPDLLLMDVNLPGAKGYELVKVIRNDENYTSLPIVFLTSEGSMQDRIEALKAGGDDHLVKPAPPGLLLNSIASRVERARLLKSLMQKDGLTGLLTHSAFMERAGSAFSRLGRQENGEAVLIMLDLDHFKAINDTHGHIVGDRVLMSLSSLLRRRLRQSDIIGRYGGEEFTILLENLGSGDAMEVMSGLLKEFREQLHSGKGGKTFSCTFSAGVAPYGSELGDFETWKKQADSALYDAKSAGRNCVKAFPHQE